MKIQIQHYVHNVLNSDVCAIDLSGSSQDVLPIKKQTNHQHICTYIHSNQQTTLQILHISHINKIKTESNN